MVSKEKEELGVAFIISKIIDDLSTSVCECQK